MLAYLLASTIPVSAIALLYARWEYRRLGKLSLLGLLLLCLMLFMPNLVFHYAVSFRMPDTMIGYTGAFISLAGLAMCLVAIVFFGSLSKVLCINTGKLTVSGLYRYSRNPQYVGWLIFLFGYALMDWSLWCLAALAVVAVSLHFLVLIEEEHLQRVFGERYREFCRQVPRYAGLAQRHT
ncbi:MAG: phosphatidylethanolamine N-methyltransferase family protein [Gammaproteobacteria bacterium]|nr:phosphatidylethanolamine N-methyltransferase family protein [Gammaproteobacteria bacterium]